jgi:response regulator RpfG family c-di-GMP phosphodiesterase
MILSKTPSPILLLSSSESSAKLFLEGLEKHGINASWAKNERESIKVLGKHPHRVVVVDDDFCRNETIEFLESLRALLPAGIDFVLLSNDTARSIADLHKAGVSTVIRKPLNINHLVDHIERILGAAGKRRFDGSQIHLEELLAQQTTAARKKSEDIESSVSHLGRGGFFYETSIKNPLPAIGSVVNFELNLTMVPNTTISGKGVIRWVTKGDGQNGIGIEFLQLSVENESFINAFTDLFKVQEFVPHEAVVPETVN